MFSVDNRTDAVRNGPKMHIENPIRQLLGKTIPISPSTLTHARFTRYCTPRVPINIPRIDFFFGHLFLSYSSLLYVLSASRKSIQTVSIYSFSCSPTVSALPLVTLSLSVHSRNSILITQHRPPLYSFAAIFQNLRFTFLSYVFVNEKRSYYLCIVISVQYCCPDS